MAEPVKKVLAGALLLTLAGCGAKPAVAGHVQTTTPSPPPTSSSSAAPAGLAALDPCGLLSPADRSSAGVPVLGKPKTIADARACDWSVPGTFGVTVTLDDHAGLHDLDVTRKTVTKKKVGAHQAMQVADHKAAGTCAVLLGVGDKASVQVDVSNSSFSDTTLACRRAGTVAGLVEPKLP